MEQLNHPRKSSKKLSRRRGKNEPVDIMLGVKMNRIKSRE